MKKSKQNVMTDDWKKRKETSSADPFELFRLGEQLEYNHDYKGKYYSGKVVVGSHVVSKSNRIVVANQRYYFPMSDVNPEYLQTSGKRWR